MIALESTRVRRAFLVSPLAAPGLLVLLSAVVGTVLGVFAVQPEMVVASILGSWVWLIYALPVSYGITALFGIPAFILLRRLHRAWSGYWVIGSAGLGFSIGVVSGIVLTSCCGSFDWLIWLAVFGAVSGASNGWLFWHVAVREVQQRVEPDGLCELRLQDLPLTPTDRTGEDKGG